MIQFYSFFLLFACINFSLISNLSANKCEVGLFGPKCQYKCHCQQLCSPEGECPDKCEDGWFGYKCQYRLISYKATNNKSQEDVSTILNDDDERTCIELDTEALVVDLYTIYKDPWIRLSIQKPEFLYGLKMSYLDKNYEIVAPKSKENILVRDYTLDVHISVDTDYLQYIILESTEIQRLCSLWINIGGERYDTIERYDINGDLFSTFTYSRESSLSAIVTHEKKPTKAFTFSMTSVLTNESITFSLCEVEAYTECSEGTWDVHCKNNCNEECPDLCRFDDGLCGNSCFGYSDPPTCKKVCKAGTWGLNCTKACSIQCFNSSCDRITGVCDKGCLGYNDPPHCTTECKAGFWGLNCTSLCNRCVESSCHSITGWCDKGCVGFENPPYCNILCKAGTWGLLCTKDCSIKCFNSSCDSVTGVCDKGCLGYSDPPHCTTACGTGTWGVNCNKTCSNNCFNSSCESKTGLCDKDCLGCCDPLLCTRECESGFWGLNCTNTCNRCVGSSCDSKSGWCDKGCLGFEDPPYCNQTCPAGYWGVNCTNKCNNSCVELSCDSVTGLCNSGCIASTNCTLLQMNAESLSPKAITTIAVSVALVLLIAIVIGLIICKVKGKLCFKRKENAPGSFQLLTPQGENACEHLEMIENKDYNEM